MLKALILDADGVIINGTRFSQTLEKDCGLTIEKMGFNKIFDEVFSSAYIGHKKPQKEFYEFILNKLTNIHRDEIIFWDNSEEHIKASRKFGIPAELYKNFEEFKKEIDRYFT